MFQHRNFQGTKMINNEKYKYSILMIEDEVQLRKDYFMYLEMLFESVYEAEDGEEAYRIYKEKKPDILIVDIHIPKLNGLKLLEKIRQYNHTTKAIVLTAHKDTRSLLEATSLKLTDYLVKPVSRRSLEQSLMKVINELRNFKTSSIKNQIFDNGYMWDYENQELTRNGQRIILTHKEQMLFMLFISNLNSTLSVNTILYNVWNNNLETNVNSLKTLLKNLRRKLPKKMIENIHGVGYKMKG